MTNPIRLLIVEDLEDDALLLVRELRQAGYSPFFERVDTAAAMEHALWTQPWDVVIADYSMPRFTALEALGILQETGLDLPFIVVSGTIGEETAVAAMKAGAHDYIMKGNLARLTPAIERELREAAGRHQRGVAEETIRHLAYYDPLTSLPNRALFSDRLQQAILGAERDRQPFGLLVMDLDRFKDVNDTLGHQCGDLLLQQVGQRLREALRASDTVARLGGDEFAVLLPASDSAGALAAATKLGRSFDLPFIVEEQKLSIAASVGIALFPEHGEDADSLLRRADVALYVAKRSNRGHAVYAFEEDHNSSGQLALMGELRTAIDEGHLVLHYQPKIAFRNGEIMGVEALVRWRHPEHGLIPPDRFIPLAEQSGLIHPLSRWVLGAALAQCRRWRDDGLALQVAVNLSMRNLQDGELPAAVGDALAAWGIGPEFLELEITESSIMANPTRAMENLRRLRTMGVDIAIDDFGTGYSSLGYLKRLPVTEIKVDRSFVVNMADDENDLAIVRSTIDLGHNLRLAVVAEGGEDAATWRLLASLGCDQGQGYYLSRPRPPADLARWVRKSASQLRRLSTIR